MCVCVHTPCSAVSVRKCHSFMVVGQWVGLAENTGEVLGLQRETHSLEAEVCRPVSRKEDPHAVAAAPFPLSQRDL